MNRREFCLGVALLIPAFAALGQEEILTLDDLVRAGEQWLQDNLDQDLLHALQGVDQEKARQLFQDLQRQFQGEYVIDLAALKQSATTLLPLLEAHEETQPYAAWLKTRLDYFDAAEELRLLIKPPAPPPGQPPKPASNPSPAVQRKVWQRQLDKRPAPKAAAGYVARLKPVFTAQRVPGQLVWLAEVESSFNPLARSPVGAAGLFQLMPATARQLGLALQPKDERLQPEKSAQAAAKYLQYLHTRFKDWRLALAAYNAGEGRVRKLLDRHQARTFDAIAIRLPAETQMYVPKIEATLLRREGVTLAQLSVRQ